VTSRSPSALWRKMGAMWPAKFAESGSNANLLLCETRKKVSDRPSPRIQVPPCAVRRKAACQGPLFASARSVSAALTWVVQWPPASSQSRRNFSQSSISTSPRAAGRHISFASSNGSRHAHQGPFEPTRASAALMTDDIGMPVSTIVW
jgi:hypothetical protein